MIRRTFATLGLAAVVAAAVAAQDDPKPRPKKAVVPDAFRAYLVTDARFLPRGTPPGEEAFDNWTVQASVQLKPEERDARDRTSKVHCLVCENGAAPVVAIFVRTDPTKLDPNSGVMKLAHALGRAEVDDPKARRKPKGLIRQYRGDKLAAFVMFLCLEGEYPAEQNDDTRDVLAQQVRDLAIKTNAPFVPFGLAPKASKMIDAWGIKPTDEVTVILYNRLRIENKADGTPARWTFGAEGPTDEQIAEILKATQASITAGVSGKR
jgi:hypothetical protein